MFITALYYTLEPHAACSDVIFSHGQRCYSQSGCHTCHSHARPCLSTGWALNRRFGLTSGTAAVLAQGGGGVQQNKAKQCTTMMAAESHTTRRKHQRQPNTQRLVWGPDPPHGTHAQPPPPTNGARAQESKAGPGGSDSAPPMGGRPCPSASKVTRTRPPREERPCPGSRGRRASWRQRSAQRGGSIAHNAALQAKAGRGTQ